jgi:hypothetical protein
MAVRGRVDAFGRACEALQKCYPESTAMRLNQKTQRFLARAVPIFLLAYVVCAGFIWWAMRQPPEEFGRVMARIPGPVAFLLFPFETLWTHARAGDLRVGDLAPDFSLLKQDKSGTLRLSSINRQQPVVLVFGSYT